jgi:serine/threonine-protein kinase
MFEMLTGRMPFTDESPLGLMLEVVKAEIPDVREINHDVDPEIARILDRMIAKDPNERYQNCHDLVAELGAHPLVAKGGPISLQPKMSAAAATMIGQKTPVSAQTSLPATPRTPASQAAAPTRVTPSGLPMPPAPPAAAPAHQSVLERSGQAPRRSALPWAIAAILLVALAGGAYAFRDRIPGMNAAPAPANAVATTPSPATNVPAQPSAPPPPATPTPAADLAAANTSPPNTLAATPTTAPGQTTAPATSADASTDASGAPAARASQAGVDALRELPAAQAAQDAPPPQIATAKVPEKPAAPPKPHVPTIAVVVGGDDVISSPAEDAMVNLLQSRGFRVIEGGHAGGDRPNLHALSGRADAVVYVNARPVGSQEIAYYGQSSTLYTVQLGVKAYRVSDGSVMWTSSPEQVNFTSLNAAEKAREAIEPMLDTVDSRLAEFRARGGRG